MLYYSTREAAKKLGIPNSTLANYVAARKVRRPAAEVVGETTTLLWTEEEIETIRKLLPKIANGRKTRYQKKHSVASNQQSTKTKPKPRSRKSKRKKD